MNQKFSKLSVIFENFQSLLLDILFPCKCLLCNSEGGWLCNICQAKIKLKNEHYCGVCEKNLTPYGQTCHACKRKHPLDGLISAVSYQEAGIPQAIHLYKYRFAKDLSLPLSNLMVRAIQSTELPLPDLILPVPLHPRRLRWRGFNQSALLAELLAQNLLPGVDIAFSDKELVRSRFTAPQMKIANYGQRQANIRDAFSITNSRTIKDKKILLVDDVATTGSTIFECARVLKKAGAKEVWAVVIARQETVKNLQFSIDR